MSDATLPTVPAEVVRHCCVRAKMDVVCRLLRELDKDLHPEKPGEYELAGLFARTRIELQQAAQRLVPLRRYIHSPEDEDPPP